MVRLGYLRSGDKVMVVGEDNSLQIGNIEEISYRGMEDCFELEVPGTHNFSCNGVVVSNSRFFRYLYKGNAS